MIWSKLKRAVEALLADTVKQHLQVHLTRYGPGESYIMNRGWITWDGEEIKTFSTMQSIQAHRKLIAETGGTGEWYTHPELEGELEKRGVYDRQRFYSFLEEYLTLSIEEALQSPDVLIRAWAMFDRRVGKRRLLALRDVQEVDPLVRNWFELRCKAEGIVVSEKE